MKQMDKICLDVIEVYKGLTKSKKFINVFTPHDDLSFQDSTVWDVINNLTTCKKSKIFPNKYTQIPFKNIVPYHLYPSFKNSRSGKPFKKLSAQNKTGLFRLDFNNGDILLIARWIEGFGRNETIRHIVVGEYETYGAYLKEVEGQIRLNEKPICGIFRSTSSQFGQIYARIKNLPKNTVIHPKISEIDNDIDYYFNNVQLFTRFKQSGVRKFMLISEPGTGKSSIFYRLASKYEKEKSIVFVTDIESAAHHLKLCAKHKVSTIIFLEDADATFGNTMGNSNVLNFLDGVDTPSNPTGAMIIMSTNFPEKIEERILLRPGRIDKIYNIDALDGKWAVECAALYFADTLDIKNNKHKIEPIVTGMTGAQIKELALASMSYAASNQRGIDCQLVSEVKSMFSKNLSEAYKYSEQNSIKKLKSGNGFGFGLD